MGATTRAGRKTQHEQRAAKQSSMTNKFNKKPVSMTQSTNRRNIPKQTVEPPSSEDEISNDGNPMESSDSNDDHAVEDSSSSEDDSINNAKTKGYSDSNASWLKPKQTKEQQLLSSSSEDEDEDEDVNEEDEFENDEDEEEEEEEEEMLDIERKSKIIDEEMDLERFEAEEEMKHVIATQTSVFHLPTAEELEMDNDRVVPSAEIRNRIQDILQVLADFKSRREPGRSRSEYIEQYQKDLAELYGYIPDLVEMFVDHFGPSEALEFMEASDKARPLVIRVNTLKARRKDLAASLLKRGVNLDPLASWSKVGLKVYDSPIPIGATPEYLAGHYMLQSASSMCPVLSLAPSLKDRVLDMSSAPGGKTSYIAQLMKNTGTIVANDLRPDRQKATMGNLARLGVRNTIVCHHDGRKLGAKMKNYFDKVLLDSPCSGLGVISRDPSVKVQRTIKDILRTVVLQKELILSAVDALKVDGYLVYSTCSVCIHENEEVVNYCLSKRNVKIVDAGLDFGKPGFTRYKEKRFHPSLELTRRFYPHVHNMDGFYIAKLQKIGHHNAAGEESSFNKDEAVTEQPKKDVTTNQQQSGLQKAVENRSKTNGSTVTNKNSKISVPPKKKKTNAKVTKPRRMKMSSSG